MRKVIYEAVEREPEIFLSGETVTQAFICILDGMFFHMLNDSRQAYEENSGKSGKSSERHKKIERR